jgi:hypothetical protein
MACEVMLGEHAWGTGKQMSEVRTALCSVWRAKHGARRPPEKPAGQWEIGLYEG